MGVADLAQQGRCRDRADADFVAQGGAVLVEQFVDEPLEASDLAARRAVLVDERLEPFEPVRAGDRRVDAGVDVGEAAQPALDLAVAGELVTDLSGPLRDLVPDMVQQQRTSGYKGTAVLKHGLDLGHQRVIDLQRLGGPERRLCLQRPRRSDRVDGVGLVQSPRAALIS